jgi:hypothetical protein
MSWNYKQSTGELFSPTGTKVAIGYAGGNCGKNPEGKNNPEMQDVRCIGPLPRGGYHFGTPMLNSHMGPFAIPLIPDANNEMLGRAGFFMHGDTTPSGNASEGCIIMPKTVRQSCWNDPDHKIDVTE